MKISNSAELQEIALATLLKNANMYAKVSDTLNESFFTDISYKLIYKCLRYYYSKYKKVPTMNELLVLLIEMHDEKFGDLGQIKQNVLQLYEYTNYDTNFVQEQLTLFIRRNIVESTFKEYLPKIQNGESVAIDEIGNALANNLNIDVSMREPFVLSDMTSLSRVREDAVGTTENPTIIKSCIESINTNLTFKGYKYGDTIMFCSSPGSGKTMFMVNECVSASLQGFNALHMFLGDMTDYDAFVRYTSRLSGIPQDDIVAMSMDEQKDLVAKCNLNGAFSRLVSASYAASELSLDEMIHEIYKIQENLKMHFDLICIDYPDNLRLPGSNMYKEGGASYDEIAKLAKLNHSVVILGSQPKICYWQDEVLPKESAAESSKKAHVIDLMITAGRPFKDSTYLTYNLAKVRRGNEGRLIRIKTEFEVAKLEQCSEREYLEYKSSNM